MSAAHRYHDGTKHYFERFASSLGYLDWASQPNPFRAYVGAPRIPLFPAPGVAPDYQARPLCYERLFDHTGVAESFGGGPIGDLLRHAMGLSAWKQFRESRWSLRVNPSSGNLHPTECYIICGSIRGVAESAGVYHYSSDRHELERRCAFDERAWLEACGGRTDMLLVALSSIHWREAWKYGERAFRYCQHDLGHAIAACSLASAIVGWRARLVPAWSHSSIAALAGLDRADDFFEAEREEPGALLAIGPGDTPAPLWQGDAGLVEAVRGGRWLGKASQLSSDHVEWTFIDEIARATQDPGRSIPAPSVFPSPPALPAPPASPGVLAPPDVSSPALRRDARRTIVQRRSAVAFDGLSTIGRAPFLTMLSRIRASGDAPWPTLWWDPCVHLLLFVHRVDGLPPGLYLLPRPPAAVGPLRAACGREFVWSPVDESLPLVALAYGDCRGLSRRVSCDQDIASDGFFSLGMLADFDASLERHGPSFYRHLFWETGVIGQVLYLEAEAAGARATGIGCFYDDPVHDVLGLKGHRFQSLYHFTVGAPVDDARLTTAPGYSWEA